MKIVHMELCNFHVHNNDVEDVVHGVAVLR